MHVAYLVSRYPKVSHTFVLREVEALRRRGIDVTTISIHRASPEHVLSEADRREFASTAALLPLQPAALLGAHARAALRAPGRYARMLRRALALARPGLRGKVLGLSWFVEAAMVWDICRRAGAHHIHAHLNGTPPSVALLARGLGGDGWTWSLTVHGPTEFYDVHGEALAEKVRDATFVVPISDFARSQLMTLVDEDHWEKLEIVHCGVDPDAFTRAAPPAPNGRLRVLNVSRVAPTKGQAVLIEAVDQLRERDVDVDVTFIGEGPRREALERKVRERGLEDRLRFVGAIGQDEIRDFYRKADVFCLPSFAEGVPVVLMEAMAMEIPVIASLVAGVTELVEDGESGFVLPPGRVDALAAALERLTDPQLRERMGAAGRQKVLQDFDIDACAGVLADVLRRRIGGGAPVPPATARTPVASPR